MPAYKDQKIEPIQPAFFHHMENFQGFEMHTYTYDASVSTQYDVVFCIHHEKNVFTQKFYRNRTPCEKLPQHDKILKHFCQLEVQEGEDVLCYIERCNLEYPEPTEQGGPHDSKADD